MSTELTAPTKIEADPIGTALVAAGVTSAAIEQLAKDYGELAQTKTIDTPEQYEVIKRAQLAHRDIRTAVTAALKEEREEAKRYQTFVISDEKRILAQIAKTEEPLKKLREAYDNRELLRQQEEARQWQEKMNLRKQAAFDIGYTFNGQAYLLDRENGEAPWVLREDQVAGMAMSDEALYALLEAQAAELKVTREIKAEAEAKAEDERKAKEAEVAKQMAEVAAEQKRINDLLMEQQHAQAAAQAELRRKEAEMIERENQMALRILKTRNAELMAVGAVEYPDGSTGFGAYTKTQPELVAMSEEDFVAFVAETKNRRMTWDAEEARKKEQHEKERLAREEQMKKEAAERAVAEERERVEAEHRRQEEEKVRADYMEAERIASMGDRGLVEQLSAYLVCAPVPDLHTAVDQHGMARVRKHLVDLTNMVNSIARDL